LVVTPISYRVVDDVGSTMAVTITTVVCAYNEASYLPTCLFSLRAQTRPPDEILIVDNASSDATGDVARQLTGVRVVDEPIRGLVVARETGRRAATCEILAYLDADCRAPLQWLERMEAAFEDAGVVAITGPYRFYDWDRSGRAIVRLYDWFIAPPTHAIVHRALGVGAILYGGNFAVRRGALERIGGCQQRFPQTETSVFVEDAVAMREGLGIDRADAAGERRRRADVVSELFVGRLTRPAAGGR
jgi:glycosyltransferase involved in cell wall biosynthesis